VAVRIASAPITGEHRDRYKWVVLTDRTVGVLIALIDSSVVLFALPAIFRGIHLDPLAPGNSFFFLWMMLIIVMTRHQWEREAVALDAGDMQAQ
jgi:hypothetical protein